MPMHVLLVDRRDIRDEPRRERAAHGRLTGAVRAGIAPYTNATDVDRLLAALTELP